jgi:hypothetical protein
LKRGARTRTPGMNAASCRVGGFNFIEAGCSAPAPRPRGGPATTSWISGPLPLQRRFNALGSGSRKTQVVKARPSNSCDFLSSPVATDADAVGRSGIVNGGLFIKPDVMSVTRNGSLPFAALAEHASEGGESRCCPRVGLYQPELKLPFL